ncbi:RNA-directed DNA polymerase [Nostoc commune]|uniref:RNA-directed DNA polymerase n=1 Tax=Nostoc commune TaxID=1178 RepID=UPI0018C8362D|nr:RNA-directed DNA polymerase [Nostoc commune]MBG1261369.1 RNA-directed DNA polymerase [Nostoc commune BAE]
MLTLQAASLDWALAHVENYGDTDVFPTPFEYKAIRHDWVNVRQYLLQDVLQWQVRPHRILLSPKARYGFRIITQLDPLDFLIFTAIVKEIGSDLEAQRIEVLNKIVFSYRFSATSDGGMFDPNVGYAQFQETSKEIIDADRTITHVALADIADFYSRIYLHRLENSLHSATSKSNHIAAIIKLLSGWNGTESFGIPVGNAPSRLLAETTISDVDEALLASGVKFVRFNDDYRIFARNHTEAYRHIAFLADVLYRNHGLTLQPQKTTILSKKDFENRYLSTPEDREIDSLRETFDVLLKKIGLTNRYEEIDYNSLSKDAKEIVDSMNLKQIFMEEMQQDGEIDFGIIRFVLRRLGQLGDSSIVDEVLDNLDVLYPAFPDIIRYLRSIRGLSPTRRSDIGTKILALLENSIISELDYHRMWALDLFTDSTEWDNEHQFFNLLANARDMLSRRNLILAMGRAGHRYWFNTHWRNLFSESDWPRRAFLAAASCMPVDARKHWYKSVESRLDPLEKAVMRWAKANPFY